MKNSLGKGLQSLIPKKESKISGLIRGQEKTLDPMALKKESVFNVEIDKIRPNPNQPRKDIDQSSLKELANSIREHGILQPLLVSKVEESTDRGRKVEYEIIAGERRWRAARTVGVPSVPVIIRDSSANEKMEVALVENIQRKDLNAIEMALAFKHLYDKFNLKHHEIAKKVGKDRATISNALRLLKLPQEIQKAISGGKISEGHGRAILTAREAAWMPIFRRVIKDNLSIRRAEEIARKVAAPVTPKSLGPKSVLFRKIENDLKDVLGRRVSITKRGDVGHVRVEFINQEELDRLVYLLSQNI